MRTRAAVMFEPGRLEQRELDVDEPLEGEVVVRMGAVGVCGTDLHSYKGEWNRPTPIVLGHEGAGSSRPSATTRTGSARATASCSRGRLPAARAGLPSRPAGRLRAALQRDRPRHALDGRTGLARTARRSSAARRPARSRSGSSSRRGGHAARRRRGARAGGAPRLRRAHRRRRRAQRGRPEPEFTALVIGAGGVGQFVVQGARIAGAPRSSSSTRSKAGAPGARAGRDSRLRARRGARGGHGLDPEGVDYAFDAVGAPATTKLALRWTRGGTAVVVGLPAAGEQLELDPLDFSNREKTLTGTIYGSEDPAVALPRLLDLVRGGRARLRAWSAPPSRSSARTTRSRPASRASPAACSSFRRVGSVDFGDNVWEVDWPEPDEWSRAAEEAGYSGVRGRRLRRKPGSTLSARSGSSSRARPGAVPLPPRRRRAPDRAARHADAALARGERELKEGEVVHFRRARRRAPAAAARTAASSATSSPRRWGRRR